MARCNAPLAATLDKRVAIQSRSRSSDGQGGFTESWSTDATVWARLRPAKGYERMLAGQLATEVTHTVTIRYRPGVTTAHRLLYGARAFDIKQVLNPDESDSFLELLAAETP